MRAANLKVDLHFYDNFKFHVKTMKFSSLFYFIAHIQLLAVPVECLHRLLNIDYLGIGYDAIQGNPQTDLEDPGFKQSIFPLEYTKNVVTADGRFVIPDNTEAYQMKNCGYQTQSEEVQDEQSYRSSLSVCKTTFFLFFSSFSFWVTSLLVRPKFKNIEDTYTYIAR